MTIKTNFTGWIKLYRSILNSPINKDPYAFQCAANILLLADKSGRLKTTIRELLKRLNWNNFNTLTSVLNKTSELGFIEIKSSRREGTLIIVINWEKYQSQKTLKKRSLSSLKNTPDCPAPVLAHSQHSASPQPAPEDTQNALGASPQPAPVLAHSQHSASPQPADINRSSKNNKNNKNNYYMSGKPDNPAQHDGAISLKDQSPENEKNKLEKDFEIWWQKYPKKEKRKQALEIWKRKRPDLDALLKALEWQVKSDRFIKGFIKQPTTYLNAESWNDDPHAYRDNSGGASDTQYPAWQTASNNLDYRVPESKRDEK